MVKIGKNWLKNWSKLVKIGQNWSKLDKIGQNWKLKKHPP